MITIHITIQAQGQELLQQRHTQWVHNYSPYCDCDICWDVTTALFPGYRLVETAEDLEELLAEVRSCTYLSFDYETYELTNDRWLQTMPEEKGRPFDFRRIYPVSAQFATKPGTAWYLPIANKAPSKNVPLSWVERVLAAKPEDAPLIAHNATFEYKVSMNSLGAKDGSYKLPGPIHDTMFMAFIESEWQRVGLKSLTERKLGKQQLAYKDLLAAHGVDNTLGVTAKQGFVYGCLDADWCLELYDHLKARLEHLQVWHVAPLEFGMIPILAEMHYYGTRVDQKELFRQTGLCTSAMEDTASKIYKLLGKEINLASPTQLSLVLYKELGLPVRVMTDPSKSKPKGSPSTANEALVYMRADAPELANLLIEWRGHDTRRKMFFEPFFRLIHEDGALHGEPKLHNKDDLGLSTGRMSYSDPNNQQWPKRSEVGRRVRAVIVPDEEHDELGATDFSQIELRVGAWMSRDAVMLDSYQRGLDLHKIAASGAFGVAEADVTKEQRFVAKTLNFSIFYGAAPGRIMKIVNADALRYGVDMKISEADAQDLVDGWFRKFPGAASFIQNQHQFARNHGYVLSMFRRKYNLPYIRSHNGQERSKAERKSVNSPIQGSAGELLKRAAINIYNDDEFQYMMKHRVARILVLIHDEAGFTYKSEIRHELATIVLKHARSTPRGFDVPIEASWTCGPNYCDLQDYDMERRTIG